MKIGLIGRVAHGTQLHDGQTVLTRTFKEEMEKQTREKIMCVDTYNYKKRFPVCFLKTLSCLLFCDHIFIMLSYNGLSFYLPFIYYSNKLLRKKIYHRVIGGNLDKLVEKKPKWKKYLNSLQYNYVETEGMKTKLQNLSITNVKTSPNFKTIIPLKHSQLPPYNEKIFKFCTFSRVIEDKGITDAIKAIRIINKKNSKTIAVLDIYGPIDEEYRNTFEELLTEDNTIKYKGIISPNKSVDILKNYYMLLFPTFWAGEGFPGTLIDSFSAGLPAIVSRWNYNMEIVSEKKTGFSYEIGNINNLVNIIEYSINNKNKVEKMRHNCLDKIQKYNPSKIINEIIQDLNNKK